MRLNKYIAKATGISRRKVDTLIENGAVNVNGKRASLGIQVSDADDVVVNGTEVKAPTTSTTIMLNKPTGYVCSREGQGSKTIYDLLPEELHKLKSIGRLDKDSSGLILLTDNGDMANQLLHPSGQKRKVYEIELNKSLSDEHQQTIARSGVDIGDARPSKLKLSGKDNEWTVTISEGRNRQIRRTFEKLGYGVTKLNRTEFGDYKLDKLKPGNWIKID
ncbi:MAG: rRNA pseudouridine synthase [bacterium]|nr:rRNA pseudouridine synthase [bacterium]